jgi:hypothetical protein
VGLERSDGKGIPRKWSTNREEYMKQETQYTVQVRLPSSDPEVLELFGYLLTDDCPRRLVVRCSRNHLDHHDAILHTRLATFELRHEPDLAELEEFAELEKRVPAWASALAEKLFEARDELRVDIRAARALTLAQGESLEGEVADLRAAIELVNLTSDPVRVPALNKTRAKVKQCQ